MSVRHRNNCHPHSWRRRRKSGSLNWLFVSRKGRKLRWIGGLLFYAALLYVAYVFLVSPSTLRWRGIFGETKMPEGYSIYGMDVSHHQGDIAWGKVRKARLDGRPIAFVFIKATEGVRMVDENFERNYAGAHAEGILCGCYHYFSPSVSAEEQARHFIRTVTVSPGDLPPVLDVEEQGSLTSEELRNAVLQWMDRVEKQYHVKPILYTGRNFWKEHFADRRFGKYPLWLAHYYVDEPESDIAWCFWQHTDAGSVDGIRGRVDLNVFNGSMYRLRQLTVEGSDSEPH